MSSKTLYRLSGIGLLAGGLLMAIGLIGALFVIGSSPPDNPTATNASPAFPLVFLLIVCGLMLIAAGLPGISTRQVRQICPLGFTGFVLTMFGVLLDLGMALFAAIVVPWLATAAPKLQFAGPTSLFVLLYGAFLVLGIGSLALGLAIAQGNALPRTAGVILIFSGLANVIAVLAWPISLFGFIGQILFAGAVAWIGYILVAQQGEEVVQPSLPVGEARSTEVRS